MTIERRPSLHDTHRGTVDKISEPGQHILSTGGIRVEHFLHTNPAQPPLTSQPSKVAGAVPGQHARSDRGLQAGAAAATAMSISSVNATEGIAAIQEEGWSWLDAPSASGYVRSRDLGDGSRHPHNHRLYRSSARHIPGLLIRPREINYGRQYLGVDASASRFYDCLSRPLVAWLEGFGHSITVAASLF